MKFSAAFILVSTILAVGYGLLFSTIYPRVTLGNAVMTLCALGGLATSLLGVGLWKVWVRDK